MYTYTYIYIYIYSIVRGGTPRSTGSLPEMQTQRLLVSALLSVGGWTVGAKDCTPDVDTSEITQDLTVLMSHPL